MTKSDGSPVTRADVGAECAVLEIVIDACLGGGFRGEELGERQGSNQRRWIVDGIDGTRNVTHGLRSGGTLIALEDHDVIVIRVASNPAQNRRWWAKPGKGAFTESCSADSTSTPISVSTSREILVERVVTLPAVENLSTVDQETIVRLAGGRASPRPWSYQLQVAEGDIDMCIWFCGDIWDYAALSIHVEESGGRFIDHTGGKRLDTRTGLYSNGQANDEVLSALSAREWGRISN